MPTYNNYDSIVQDPVDPNRRRTAEDDRKDTATVWIVVWTGWACAALLAIVVFFQRHDNDGNNNNSNNNDIDNNIPMPTGVNFGSWLSLEDYFFASGAAEEVATPFGKTQAACLPPLYQGEWQSETDLLEKLCKDMSLADAVRVFHAHRLDYIDLDQDLAELQRLGIRRVRVPLSWCLTDLDPQQDGVTDQNAEHFTCTDPFYPDVRWPAVPRSMIVRLLRACEEHGIRATLDVHTYPGATSIGTFSGLWPRWPRFWKHDTPESPQDDVGRTLLRNFVQWLESLADSDPLAFRGLGAISPMNEPAHLAGLFGPNDTQAFLPDLPPGIAQPYLMALAPPATRSLTTVPDGPHLRVLLWLRDAVQVFRESSLAQLGKEFHVNVHESIFRAALVGNDALDPGGRHPTATKIIAAWWRATTTSSERTTWAVLDMHHYHAWEPACSGTVVVDQGNYTCGDAAGRAQALARCSSWATETYRGAVDAECGPGARLASGEFSAATHHQVRHACNDVTTLQASYLSQLRAAEEAGVELYYWSFKMPYGGAFRSAWSFRQLMHLLGVTARPDVATFDCGTHAVQPDEPSDDIFS